MGKSKVGVLELSSKLKPDSFQLKLRDDGQGIKLGRLKQKILDSGKWTQNEVEEWNETELLYKIFEPGISTHDSSDYISGRGIGMDIIKYKLTKANGNINIDHKPGSYCEFVISLPLSKN
jgi:chemotaxis protein histidine kinase CheA